MLSDCEISKIKKEIGYKTACAKCTDCGNCDTLLKQAIDEASQLKGEAEATENKPCAACRL